MRNSNIKLTLWEYCQRKKIAIDEMKKNGYDACVSIANRIGCEAPLKSEFENLIKPSPEKIEEKLKSEEIQEMKKILAEIPTRQKQNILDSRVVLTDSIVQPGSNVESGEEIKSDNLSEELTSTSNILKQVNKNKKVLL